MKLEHLMEVVNQYSVEAKSVQEYIPNANIDEIYIVAGLQRFLASKNDKEAYEAIRNTNEKFQKYIGFQQIALSFDEEKLRQLIKNISVAAIKQKQMSGPELLARMKNYHELVMKQESEKNNMKRQIGVLMNMEESLLYQGLNSAGITAGKAKEKYKRAIALMRDGMFKKMKTENQVNVLHNVVVANESVETALKREWLNKCYGEIEI